MKKMIKINRDDKILIVAPHPDDESIGMGGFLSLYGPQCDVLLVTDGRKGHKGTVEDVDEFILKRKQEVKSACQIANVHDLFFLNIEDRTTLKNKSKVKNFDISKYTYIFIPNRNETHIDHCVLYSIFKRKLTGKQKLLEYEVWTPMSKTNMYLDISDVVEKKKEMISQHKSQLVDCDYVNRALALNYYRGMYYHCEYAEVYNQCDFSWIGFLKYRVPILWKARIKQILEKLRPFNVF